MDGRLEHLQIQPSNIISTNKVSFKNGNPVIQFIIGEQDKYLLGNSLRFTGDIQFLEGVGDAARPPVNASLAMLDPKLGAYSVISEVAIFSQRSKQQIEHIRHYGRFLSSYLPALASKQEAQGHMNKVALMYPNHEVERLGVVNNLNGSGNTAGTRFSGNSFCLHLPTGLLNSQEPIPLSANGWGTGGLLIEITLENDSQVLFSKDGTSLSNCYYQLSNMNMIMEVVQPSADTLSSLVSQSSGSLEYNSISSYYTSVNSTNAIVNFNLGLSKCLGCFFNVIPSTYLNNTQQNGFATLPFTNSNSPHNDVARLRQIIFTRGGTKFPNQFNTDTNVKLLANSIIYNPEDPQVIRSALNSFMPYSDIKNTQFSPVTFTRALNADGEDINIADGGCMFAVGTSFDSISNAGVDFSSVNLGIQMDIELTTDFPNTIFLFVRNKNTLVFNANGLQVIS
tara:strand:- start:5481 stop:6836 length:1356 start_codon:yes stop_codon:yes gene_type:complete